MPSTPDSPTSSLRRARAAVSAVFFVNAVLYANLVPRLPEVKDRLDLTNAAFGAAVAGMPVGALVSGLFAALLIQRLGSARVASFGLVLLAVTVGLLPLAPSWVAFAGLMVLAGALDSVIDVAQNAHGFRVQRAYGRSIVNAFHGLWSVGAVAGGLLGSLAAGLAVPLPVHLAVTGVVFSGLAVVAYRFLLPGPEDAERVPAVHPAGPAVHPGDTTLEPAVHTAAGTAAGTAVDAVPTPARRRRAAPSRRTVLVLAALGALAAAGAFVEDAGSSWGALFMRVEVGADAATAGLAFVALSVAMTVGRLTGDRVVDRFGQPRVTTVGGAAVAAGFGLALAAPSVATTVVGFAAAGLGVATLVPAVMHVADELPGLPHGLGLTVVSWLLRVGFLVSPTVVGLVADAADLRVALLGVVLAGVVTLALGPVLRTPSAR